MDSSKDHFESQQPSAGAMQDYQSLRENTTASVGGSPTTATFSVRDRERSLVTSPSRLHAYSFPFFVAFCIFRPVYSLRAWSRVKLPIDTH